MNNSRKKLIASLCFMLAFVAWTAAVKFVDVKPIGPNGSTVGFASINGYVHSFSGVNKMLYTITDRLGLVPLFTALCFATLGFVQLIKRKSIKRVDGDIIVLGIFYAAVMLLYLLFEVISPNFRPVLINGVLEASYPSSTTVLVMCIMPTSAMQLKRRLKSVVLKRFSLNCIYAFTLFMVCARLVSGVHWLSDIVGGVLISISLVSMYSYFSERIDSK